MSISKSCCQWGFSGYSGFLPSFITELSSANKRKLKQTRFQLSNLKAELSLRTTWHVTCCTWYAPNVLYVIWTWLHPGFLSEHVGDSSWHRNLKMSLSMSLFLFLSYLSRSLADRWGTTVDFTTSFLHSSRFSAFRSVMFHGRSVHSLMLSSHRFLCLPLRLPPWTVPCRIVLASPVRIVLASLWYSVF